MLFAGGFAVLVWWLGTGVLLYLNRLPESTYPFSLLGGCAAAGIAAACIEAAAGTSAPIGAYLGFAGAVLLWGCLEMPFLMGRLTGPVREPCPPDLKGWRRFLRAVNVGLYHDLLIVFVGSLLWLVSDANKVAALTFSTLWLLRWSAKLNLFLGVANFEPDLVPARLDYLTTYMRKRRMNGLFPATLLIGAVLCAVYASLAFAPQASAVQIVSATLVGVLTLLGLLEHILLMVPVSDTALWRWAVDNLGGRRVNEREI